MDAAATSFVLGYHGCDRETAERVFAGQEILRPSHNDYDWLGDGIYLWEHNARRGNQETADAPPFDTVRAAFTEGGPLHDNAGFSAKSHIQVCVRNTASIKGYFRPHDENGRAMIFD